MIFFVTFLRAMAACLITNAHYTGIYPTDIIANGGLLGDVLFFAVSGYCLYHVKYDRSLTGFARWYGKRIWRVYLPVLLITALFMVLGAYRLSGDKNFLWWYLYPTNYHFVASIMVLYIPFFFLMKSPRLRVRLPAVMAVIAVVWMLIYWTVYDRSRYHIDVVREPMIRFLFMESMLLGAWFRQQDGRLRNRFRWIYPVAAAFTSAVYFAGKLLLSRQAALAPLQFLNQLVLFALLFLLFRLFCGLDGKLERMPGGLRKIICLISGMTLEIYVVQYVIIDVVRAFALFFPLNWVVLTASILLAAWVLHKLCGLLYRGAERMLAQVRQKGEKI